MTNAELGKIDHRGLGGEAHSRIRDAILSGRLRDGDRIVEREWADELGVSRGPIRDAIRELVDEGLIEVAARRGARVASFTVRDVRELLDIRAGLEPIALEAFLALPGDAHFQALETVVNRLAAASHAADWSDLVLADLEFHNTVFTLAGRRRLLRIWEGLRAPLLHTMRVHRRFYEDPAEIYRQHRDLYEIYLARDISAARPALLTHMLEFHDRLDQLVILP